MKFPRYGKFDFLDGCHDIKVASPCPSTKVLASSTPMVRRRRKSHAPMQYVLCSPRLSVSLLRMPSLRILRLTVQTLMQ